MESVMVIREEVAGCELEQLKYDNHQGETVACIRFFAGGYGEFHFSELAQIFRDPMIREIMYCIQRWVDREEIAVARAGRFRWLRKEIQEILARHND
jgi:hypothetical protein